VDHGSPVPVKGEKFVGVSGTGLTGSIVSIVKLIVVGELSVAPLAVEVTFIVFDPSGRIVVVTL
jgi:hypothetical protein